MSVATNQLACLILLIKPTLYYPNGLALRLPVLNSLLLLPFSAAPPVGAGKSG